MQIIPRELGDYIHLQLRKKAIFREFFFLKSYFFYFSIINVHLQN